MRRPLRAAVYATLSLSLAWPGAGTAYTSRGARSAPVAPMGPALLAGAHAVDVAPPRGVPLAGYGGSARRLLIPDFLNRYPYAFWFKPSTGIHDPIMARALILHSGDHRLLWVAVDLIGVEPEMVSELKGRLAAMGLRYEAVILSASHTHSGPGAFSRSRLFSFIALDSLVPDIRERILNAIVGAARQAESQKVPARIGIGRGEVTGATRSRVGLPLDPDVGVLKVVSVDGRPIALLWNYAIHGTVLRKSTLALSGDVMGAATRQLEQALGIPVLYTNGAVGDVSPALHGWAGLRQIAEGLSREVLTTWRRIPVEPSSRLWAVSERISLPPPRLSVKNCLGRWVPTWLTVGIGWAFPTQAELVAVAVGTSAWVTIPGELQTRLGQAVKAEGRRHFRHAFVVGVSNDYAGYFLTPEEYRRPRYIACASLYGEAGGRVVAERATAMFRRLGDLEGRRDTALRARQWGG
ncbi:MAG: neutral/alkaline non-lysosomal ceramidase N-terminal domain-containing protein [Candidatus Rokubacteria bacterium]|nr:neutral/alkaline non-lysosomal ceramidase N-terminal domain-containing protein [Candidatus Rokubacteria bacterium]